MDKDLGYQENGITNTFEAYNNSEEEVKLDGEDGQLDTSAHFVDERIYPMKSIKVERGFYTSYELKRKYDKKPSLVILDSDFQRESVWGIQQKRELIESILMGLPLPIFYFNQDKKGRLVVIDGRQRLNAIFSFMDNGFALDKLKILDEFNKKKFEDLDPVYQSKIEDYQLMAHVIQPMTPDRVKFDIFDRVNRAGTKLNKQEIRNALYQGKVTVLLNELSKTDEFNEATENYFLKDKRMKNRYLLIRFIAFYLYYNNQLYKNNNVADGLYQYSSDIDDFLGLAMDYLNSVPEETINEIKRITLDALRKISFYLGENAFRLIDINPDGSMKRYPININIFETLMLAMTFLPSERHELIPIIRNKVNDLKNDSSFRNSLNNHRDSDIKVGDRYLMIKRLIGEIANDKAYID
ncbi:MAG: DUF262 domain-containing protein [Ruminococcaceae bacterium]|nr:DUF262 domain-containing protein [Oscillospiraceae bacterium]